MNLWADSRNSQCREWVKLLEHAVPRNRVRFYFQESHYNVSTGCPCSAVSFRYNNFIGGIRMTKQNDQSTRGSIKFNLENCNSYFFICVLHFVSYYLSSFSFLFILFSWVAVEPLGLHCSSFWWITVDSA